MHMRSDWVNPVQSEAFAQRLPSENKGTDVTIVVMAKVSQMLLLQRGNRKEIALKG